MQFCKGIQVAALLAALSTAGLAAPVAEANAIAAPDGDYGAAHSNDYNSYGKNDYGKNDYGKNDYGNGDDYDYSTGPKCDDDHTINAYSWKDYDYNGHKIKIFIFKNKYFTYGRDKKYYVYDVATKIWSPCKSGQYDFRAVKPFGNVDYYYDPSYGSNYDSDGYSSGHDGHDGHDGYDSDGYSSGHDDYDGHKIIYGKDISSYFSKFDWSGYTSKYNKFQTKAVKWYPTKINGHDAEYYIESGHKYTWAKYNNVYVVFVYDNASKRWGFDPHHTTRPSTWCKKFATIDYFYGKNDGYDSDHDNYDPSYGKGYDSDSDKDNYDPSYAGGYGSNHGEDASKYYKVLYADKDLHAVYFNHNSHKVYCAADGFYTYNNGRFQRYTALKFSADYYKNSYFTNFFSSHKSLYTDRKKWKVIKVGKNYGSGYDSHSEHDPHSDSDSDCSDSDDDNKNNYAKGYGSKATY